MPASLGLYGTAGALDDDELQTAHEALLKNPRFDLDYVVPTPIPERETREYDNWFTDFLEAFFGFIGPLLGYIFWAIVIAFVALLLFYIGKEALRLQRSKRPKPVAEDAVTIIPSYQPHESTANVLLADVDALAAQGLYAEAVHELLLRTITDLRANRPKSIPRDLTSREIATLDILSDDGQAAFAAIGQRVERSHFGGRPLTQEDFIASRAAYESFAFGSEHSAVRRRRRS